MNGSMAGRLAPSLGAIPTAFITTVAVAGGGVLAWSALALQDVSAEPLMVGLLMLLAAGAQRMPIFLFRNSAVSVAFAATITGYVLYGPAAGVLVQLAAAVVNAFTPKLKPFEKVVFNTGNLTLSALAAALSYQLVGGQVPPGAMLPTILAVAFSGLVYFFVNTTLLSAVIAMTTAQPFRDIYRENYSWQIVNWIATSINGAALALAYQSLGIFGAAVFVLPIGAAWYSFRLYMVKSKEVRHRNEELVVVNETLEQMNVRLEESYRSVIGALVGALEAKDRYTEGHSTATMFYAVELARRFGLPEEEIASVQLGALFHDIGKIGIPEQILRKEGPLNNVEWEEMKTHATIGGELLAHVPTLMRIRPIVEAHHERYDGTGYPKGLKGDEIPFASQIITVADSFHAMTSDRAYRKAMPKAAAIAELRRCAGTQFNPAIVEAFLELLATREQATERAPRGTRLLDRTLEAVTLHRRLS